MLPLLTFHKSPFRRLDLDGFDFLGFTSFQLIIFQISFTHFYVSFLDFLGLQKPNFFISPFQFETSFPLLLVIFPSLFIGKPLLTKFKKMNVLAVKIFRDYILDIPNNCLAFLWVLIINGIIGVPKTSNVI